MSDPKTTEIGDDELRNHRSRAFDLSDALSKSGGSPLTNCSLHVIVAATHCFDRSLMNTLIRDNINPIDHAESSELIVASTLFDKPNTDLLK